MMPEQRVSSLRSGWLVERWETLIEELRAEFLLREEELQLLREIDLQLLGSERPLATTFDFIVQRSQDLIKADHTHILLCRGRYLEGSYSTKDSDLGQRIEISACLAGQCLMEDRPVRIPDVTTPEYAARYVPIKGYVGEPMRSLLAVPIKVHDTMVGVLNAESTRVGAFTSVHENFLLAIASQVAMALQRAQLFDRDALFADVDQLIFSTGDSPYVIQSALERVMQALRDLEHIALSEAMICFRRGQDLEIVHSTRPSDVGLVLGIDESICGRAVRERKTIVLGDVDAEPEYRRLFGTSIRSEIAVPILLGDDDDLAIGVLNVESEEFDAFQGFSQVILESFADKVRILLAFAKLRSNVTEAMDFRNATDLLVAVGDQTSNMIHRMNNTVGAMKFRVMELQGALERGELARNEFLTESLEALRALAERTLQMPEEVTQLLGQKSSTVDVDSAVHAALGKIQVPPNVNVQLDLSPDLPLLSLYCFDVVIQNLLQNAIDAMPDGGLLSVSTSSVIQEELPIGYVQLIVRDTGTGISDEILPRIFDLNFSTKHSGAKGRGLGLGLWWIRNFVRRANGDITAISTVNVGSSFTVKIPFERPSAQVRSTKL
jgi:signal transduction histidine kinase